MANVVEQRSPTHRLLFFRIDIGSEKTVHVSSNTGHTNV